MAFVSYIELFEGRKGSTDDKGVRHYTRTFLVTTDSLLDGPLTVTPSPPLPALYSSYVTLNESDIGAIMKSVTADQHEDNPYLWTVTAEYDSAPMETMDQKDPSNPDNTPSDKSDNRAEPKDRPWTFTFGHVQTSRILVQDLTGADVTNSAGQPFDPPVEVPCNNPTIKINAWTDTFDFSLITTYQDAVNSDAWQGFPPLVVRCTDYTATSHYDNGQFCWQLDIVVEIKWDGWNPIKVLDCGTVEIAQVDRLVGGGVQARKQIVDAYGQPIHAPVPLDGSGKQLTPGNAFVYKQFQGYRTAVFANMIP